MGTEQNIIVDKKELLLMERSSKVCSEKPNIICEDLCEHNVNNKIPEPQNKEYKSYQLTSILKTKSNNQVEEIKTRDSKPISILLPKTTKWEEIDDEFYKHLHNIYDEDRNTLKTVNQIQNLKTNSIKRSDLYEQLSQPIYLFTEGRSGKVYSVKQQTLINQPVEFWGRECKTFKCEIYSEIDQLATKELKKVKETDESNSNLIFCTGWIKGRILETKNKLKSETPSGSVIAQIDNGSAVSLCSRKLVNQFQLKTHQECGIRLVPAMEKKDSRNKPDKEFILDERADFPITFVGKYRGETTESAVTMNIRCRVTEDSSSPLLIGGSDMNQYRMITHSNGLIIIMDEGREFILRDHIWNRAEDISKQIDMLRLFNKEELKSHAAIIEEINRSTVERATIDAEEKAEFNRYKKKCTNDPRQEILRPEAFPHKYWMYVPDEIKPLVGNRYSQFSTERLEIIIPKVEDIDISEEDEQRYAEQPYIRALLYANLDVFFVVNEENPNTVKGIEDFNIEVNDNTPIVVKNRRGYSLEEKAFLHAKTNIMERQGRLQRRKSPNCLGLVLVPYAERIEEFKKKYGDKAPELMFLKEHEVEVSAWYRLTTNFKPLNQKIVQPKFPMPLIHDLVDKVESSGRWTAGDVADAFFTINMEEGSRDLTGFQTHEDHFVYTIMPQGISTAAEKWASVISETLSDLLFEKMFFYQDDVFIYDNKLQEHLDIQGRVFERMRRKGMIFKPSKYHSNYRMMKVLGHIMTEEGRMVNPELTRAINQLDKPTNQSEVRSMVGLAIVAKEYVRGLSEMIAPLQDLMKKNVNVIDSWTVEHDKAFEELKRTLTSEPLISHIQVNKKFRIHVDACRRGRGMGAVLLQQNEKDENRWYPVAYWSMKLTETEREYSATDIECKALHDAIFHWAKYLQNGLTFEVVTDHYALVYLATKPIQDSNGRIMRYVSDLVDYKFSVIHRKGGQHLDADAISRLLRYGDHKLRLLTRDQLQDGKIVNTEDEADLLKYFKKKLPRKAKKEPTAEEKLELDEPVLTNSKKDQSSVSEIIEGIELRHELEELNNTPNDVESFQQYYRQGLNKDVLKRYNKLEEECKPFPLALIEEVVTLSEELDTERNIRDDKVYRRVNSVQNIEDKRKVRFQRLVHVKYFYKQQTAEQIQTRSENEGTLKGDELDMKSLMGKKVKIKMLVDELIEIKDESNSSLEAMVESIKIREKSREQEDNETFIDEMISRALTRSAKQKIQEIFKEVEGKIERDIKQRKSSNDSELDSPRKTNKLKQKVTELKEKKQTEIITRVSQAINNKIDSGEFRIEGTETLDLPQRNLLRNAVNDYVETNFKNKDEEFTIESMDEDFDIEKLRETPYLNLIGKFYEDDVTGRLYMVTDIRYNEIWKAAVANRTPMDGMPPDEGDDEEFIVEGSPNDITGVRVRCELYERTNPTSNYLSIISEQEMLDLQMKDKEIQPLLQLFDKIEPNEDGLLTLETNIMSGNGRNQVFVWKPNHSACSIRRVYEKIHTKHNWEYNITTEMLQIVTPALLIPLVLRVYHDNYAHPSYRRMYTTIRLKYYWKTINQDIENFASRCRHCQLRKASMNKKNPLQVYPGTERVFQRTHMDLAGPFQRTKAGYVYILIFTDYLSKWVEIIPIKSKNARDVAECVFDEILMRHGSPEQLITDQGREFENELFRELSTLLRIRRGTTAPYHPRADGAAEKMVSTIKDALTAYTDVFQSDWDKYLKIVAHCYRNTEHIATGFTPYFMLYGRECKHPDELWVKSFNKVVQKQDILVDDYVRGLSESMELIWAIIGQHLQKQSKIITEKKNKDIKRFVEFQPGDKVLILRVPKPHFMSADLHEKFKISRGLQDRYKGPYSIVEKISPSTYRVNIKGQIKHIALDQMKKYKG